MRGLRDLDDLLEVARQGGIGLWLHGHRHNAYLPSPVGRGPVPGDLRRQRDAERPVVLQRLHGDRAYLAGNATHLPTPPRPLRGRRQIRVGVDAEQRRSEHGGMRQAGKVGCRASLMASKTWVQKGKGYENEPVHDLNPSALQPRIQQNRPEEVGSENVP